MSIFVGLFATRVLINSFFIVRQELCSKESEFKAILFSLCYFHACVCERRKFGPQGWNISYPFSIGDLTISVYVLFNYLEGNRNIPWDDLRFLFGEIMYGGHIVGSFFFFFLFSFSFKCALCIFLFR